MPGCSSSLSRKSCKGELCGPSFREVPRSCTGSLLHRPLQTPRVKRKEPQARWLAAPRNGGVYGTRTRGLRRDSHASFVSTHGNESQAPAAAAGSGLGSGDASQRSAVFRSQAVTPWLQSAPALVVPHDRLLTVREVATRLGVSTSTIYKLCAQGRLVHVRVSNAIRVSATGLGLAAS